MEAPIAYLPMDRRQALARGEELPDRTHGAALFADVSGFTPLTEALVRALGPRRGAEELTQRLNEVYDALIAEVDRFGGSVLTFSGDAITCWLDGDDGRRATACGLAMQQAMCRFAAVPIPSPRPEHSRGAGTTSAPPDDAPRTVALAMKAAVAVGPARRFVVGDPAIQTIDVLAGETLQRMAAAEHQARKGEVVLDGAALARLDGLVHVAEWRVDGENGRRYAVADALAQPVAPAPWPPIPPQALPDALVLPWLLPPVYERLRGGQGEFLAELRSAVALFVRFGGIDYDHDDAAGVKLDAYVRHVQRVLARYGGYLLQVTIGDKGSYLYAAFGAPIAHDDDATRAVAAALDLRDAGAELAAPVQIGISLGRLRVGAYGGATRRTYGVLGDDVNLAARLMSAARPGHILISERAGHEAARHFELRPVGALTVKGKREPVLASEILGRRSRSMQRPTTLYANPLVGRDAELARMTEVVEAARGGEGRILRLVGAAGVGKSHLSAELMQRALTSGLRVAVGACQSTMQETAYAPWRQVFRALLEMDGDGGGGDEPDAAAERLSLAMRDLAARANPDWLLRLPLLGDLLGLPIPDNATTAAFDARLRRGALFDLASEMLHHWARERPLLLLIDDVHWMDEASRDLTLAVGRGVGRAPIVLTLVQRPPQPGQDILPELSELPAHHHLNLDELTPAGVGALVAQRLDGEPAPLALALIQSEAQGNPFCTEELVETLRESGRLYRRADGHWSLSDATFAALRQAGCLEYADGEWMLAPHAPLSAVDLGLPDSVEGMVLSRLDRLPEEARLTLRVASVIGRTFALDVLAAAHPLHPSADDLAAQIETLQARDFARLEAPPPHATYMFKHNVTHDAAYGTLLFAQRTQLHRAVGAALEQTAPDAVPQLAHHAFLGEDWPRALRYQMLAGRQARRLFATHEGAEHFEKALLSAERLPPDDTAAQRQEIHAALGELCVSTSRYDAAGDHLGQALELARTRGDSDGQVRACRDYARLYELRGDFVVALEWIDRALDALAGRETADAAEALITAGLIQTRRGDYAGALQRCRESQRIAEHIGEVAVVARAYGLLGIINRQQGNSGQAIPYFQQSLNCYNRIENVHGQGRVHNEIANAYFFLGRWTDADHHFRQAREIFSRIGDVYYEAFASNNLGTLALNQGRLDEALTFFQHGLQSLEQIGGSLYVVATFHMNLGATLIRQGDTETARQHLHTAREFFARAQSRDFLPELHRHLAEAALLAGEVDMAALEADESLAVARELALRGEEGCSLRVLGEATAAQGDLECAEGYLREGIAILEEVSDAYEQGRGHLALVRVELDRSNIGQARESLERCLTIFEQLGASLDLAAARALYEELAVAR